MIYFIYKPNFIAGIGGVMPPEEHDTTKLRIGEIDGWYLGKTEDINLLHRIREFNPIVISQNAFEGFKYYNTTSTIDPNSPDKENPILIPLTTEQLAQKDEFNKVLSKLNIRSKVETQIGDVNDIISDLSKRLVLLERICLSLFNNVTLSTPIPQEHTDLVAQLTSDLQTQLVKDPIDVSSDTLMDIYNKLKERNNILTTIMDEYFNPPVV